MSNSDPTPWRSDVCMASRRLFIGLMANAAAQAAISHYQLRCDWPSTPRLTDPGRLHITLEFLGNLNDTDEVRLSSALANVPMAPLYLRLTRAEMFSKGIAVLRVEENRDLEHLQGDIAALVQSLGIPIDSRPWLPHVTIAREAMGDACSLRSHLPSSGILCSSRSSGRSRRAGTTSCRAGPRHGARFRLTLASRLVRPLVCQDVACRNRCR